MKKIIFSLMIVVLLVMGLMAVFPMMASATDGSTSEMFGYGKRCYILVQPGGECFRAPDYICYSNN